MLDAAHLSAELSTRTAEIEHLKLVLAKLRRMQFGRRSEKLDQQIEQLELKLEDLEAEAAVTEVHAPVAMAPRKKAERKPLPAHLPREDRVLRPDWTPARTAVANSKLWAKTCRNSWSMCRRASASSVMCVRSWPAPAAIESCRQRRPAVLSNAACPAPVCWHTCW
jgi:hypothetical protein